MKQGVSFLSSNALQSVSFSEDVLDPRRAVGVAVLKVAGVDVTIVTAGPRMTQLASLRDVSRERNQRVVFLSLFFVRVFFVFVLCVVFIYITMISVLVVCVL